MANLIQIYYINDDNNLDKNNYIPGDIIILIQDDDSSCITRACMIRMYIINLQRQMLKVSICQSCQHFHLDNQFIKSAMGIHWEKYKHRWYRLGLPINDLYVNECA